MKQHELALLFLRKAAEDEALVNAVLNDETVSDASVGFHCQQAAEKLLKALLAELGVPFGRTHDLGALADLLESAGQSLPENLRRVDEWTPFAVQFRYDELPIDPRLDRTEARERIAELRILVESRVTRL
jgi:HEPN domain-containing protein